MSRSKLALLAVCSLTASVLASSSGWSAPGDLDRTFSSDGLKTVDVGDAETGETRDDFGEAVLIRPDGKILVAGSVKVNPDNTADDNDWGIVRLMPNGSLDSTFGGDGIVTTALMGSFDDAADIISQPNGRFLVAGDTSDGTGERYFAAGRYNANGTLDTDADGSGFDEDGLFVHSFGAGEFLAAAARDGSRTILAGGMTVADDDSLLVRLRADGSLDQGSVGGFDEGFDDDGYRTIDVGDGGSDRAEAVAVQQDRKIVVAGYVHDQTDYDFYLLRLNPDGSHDDDSDGSAFGASGTVFLDFRDDQDDVAQAVALGPNGTIYVGGSSKDPEGARDFAIARYTANGQLDEGWGGDGKVITPFGDVDSDEGIDEMVVQPDGRVVAVGFGTGDGFRVARYKPNGTLDHSFGGDGLVLTRFPPGNSGGADDVALQKDGRIVVAGDAYKNGDSDFAVARYRVDRSATKTTLQFDKGKDFIDVWGAVSPNHSGKKIVVTLLRKQEGKFVWLSRIQTQLDSESKYAEVFSRFRPGTCKLKAFFPGDAHHLASQAAKTFTC